MNKQLTSHPASNTHLMANMCTSPRLQDVGGDNGGGDNCSVRKHSICHHTSHTIDDCQEKLMDFAER